MKRLVVVGTMDTKYRELDFLRRHLGDAPTKVMLVDVGTQSHDRASDVTAREIAQYHPQGAEAIWAKKDRGMANAAMARAFAEWCRASADEIGGIIGLGGGGGTSMITTGMRQLPYGVPKVMVSTLASGDTSGFVDISDIIMVPSVTDVAGLNRFSGRILANAAAAMVGMMAAETEIEDGGRPAIALTMFGVTTPVVTAAAKLLDRHYDTLVFHATGTGGRAMERLGREGHLAGVLDLTTTEIADHLCGGVLSAGADRLSYLAEIAVPCVIAPGAVDMVNFWAPDSVPAHYRDRLLYNHNDNVTLMRTNAEECRKIGTWLAEKLNAARGPVRVLLPEKGISALDVEGGAFFDPQAREALFVALEETLTSKNDHRIERLPLHINEPAFSEAAVATFTAIAKG